MWTKSNIPDLSGKIAIVTGSNTGIGFETAKALFEAGAQVTIAARDVEKAKNAIQKIQSDTAGTGSSTWQTLDRFGNLQITLYRSIQSWIYSLTMPE